MKYWRTIGCGWLALSCAPCVQALPSFDPFANATANGGTAYANATSLAHQTNALGESWAQWNGGTATFKVNCTNVGLSYTGFPAAFPAPSLTNAVYLPGQVDQSGGASGLSAALTFSRSIGPDPKGWANNKIYASFLVKVANLGNLNSGAPIYFAGFATNRGDQSVSLPASALKIYLKGDSATAGSSTSFAIGLADNSGFNSAAWDGGGHKSSDVLFVVVDYEFGINGAPDAANLWVNPAGGSFGAAGPPAPSASTAGITNANRIAGAADFFLLARTGASLWGGLFVSDLRVGESWSYVTGGPEIPVLDGPLLSAAEMGANFILSCTNGKPGATNFLLSATNILLPLTNWTSVATNLFDESGRFNITNAIQRTGPGRFYSLRVPSPWGDAGLWVPPCGAWLGAAVTNGTTQNFSDHEAKIGRQLDVMRIYHTPGSWTKLTTTELNYINAGRKLLLSVKPSSLWSNAVGVANGGSATVDSQMASLAQSIAGVKPMKVMLIVWHEPENDVIGSGGNPGTTGTPAQYVAMWHNVRSIFDANSATNVIWCWCIQNLSQFRGLLSSLWPGNNYVDWVMWDAYQDSSTQTLTNVVQDGYTWLLTNSNATNNYAGKFWGLAELGVGINSYFPTVADQTNNFNRFNTALNVNNQFPKLKLISYFDDLASALLPGAVPAYSNYANSFYLRQRCPP